MKRYYVHTRFDERGGRHYSVRPVGSTQQIAELGGTEADARHYGSIICAALNYFEQQHEAATPS